MDKSKLRKVTIDQTLFSLAFDRDLDFHDAYPIRTYLDLETGETNWVLAEHLGIPAGRVSDEKYRAIQNIRRYVSTSS